MSRNEGLTVRPTELWAEIRKGHPTRVWDTTGLRGLMGTGRGLGASITVMLEHKVLEKVGRARYRLTDLGKCVLPHGRTSYAGNGEEERVLG